MRDTPPPPEAMPALSCRASLLRTSLLRHLYVQVLVAALLGVAVGALWPAFGAALEPIGQAFVKLVRLIINPLVFCTLVLGISGMHGAAAGRIGGRAMVYFEIMSTLALLVGLAVALLVKPGAGFEVTPGMLDAGAVAPYAQAHAPHTLEGFLLNIIPQTVLSAFTGGDIVQVLFVSLLAGVALSSMGTAGEPIIRALRRVEQLVFSFAGILLRVAPLGAFGAMAFVIGKFGVRAVENLGLLILTLYITELVFVLVVLGSVARLCGFSILKLLRYIKDELLIVLGTSSAETGIPTLMPKLERAGAPKAVVGLVVPGGYAFNADGTNIYLTLSILFICQATGTELSFGQLATVLVVAMLTSKGAGGITGSSFVALISTLTVVHEVPLAGAALILGVDRFLSEARSVTNVIGNTVATLAVAKWEGVLDMEALHACLDSPAAPPEPALA
ncbi:MAG: C4-dicarboxylate transporter DctA [Pseudomonadota bacterium]